MVGQAGLGATKRPVTLRNGERLSVRRSLFLWTVIGSVIGVLLALGARQEPASEREPEAAVSFEAAHEMRESVGAPPAARNAVGGFAERVDFYAAASAANDADWLVAHLEEALAGPLSPAVIAQSEALLGRLFELDTDAAVATVRGTKLPKPLLSPVFRRWAEIDSEAAIDLLRDLDDAPKKRLLAAEIIDVVGIEAISAVVAADPALDADGLATAALVRRAERDLPGALREVANLPMPSGPFVIAEIARIAAAADPSAAIEALHAIEDLRLKQRYVEALHTELSLGDLTRWFAFLETLDSNAELPDRLTRRAGFAVPPTYLRALENAAASDAAGLRELGRELGGELGLAAEAEALEVLSAKDPASVLSYLESLPAGTRRDRLAVSIAEGYARHDIDAALAWAWQLHPPERRVRNAVLGVLAETDLARAVHIDLDNRDTTSGRVVDAPDRPSWFGNRLTTDLDDPAGIADDIAALAPGRWWKEARLSAVLSQWAIDDPDAVISWMRAHRSDLSADIVAAVADVVTPQVANADAEWLIAFGDLLDRQRRPEWLTSVVAKIAREDPYAALIIAERYRSEPLHDYMLARVIDAVARRDGPAEAARLLGPTYPQIAVMSLASEWARLDSAAAAAWAIALPNEQARLTAVRTAAGWWAETDAAAAIAWARNLDVEALRSAALKSICGRSPGSAACE